MVPYMFSAHQHCEKTQVNIPMYEMNTGITFNMRSILVDWLVDVHVKFAMQTETFFLGISILDRFLYNIYKHGGSIAPTDLQCLGAASLWIASKAEEIYPTGKAEYVELSAGQFTCEELMRAEIRVLRVLEYQVWEPHSLTFLQRMLRIMDVSEHEMLWAKSHFFLQQNTVENNRGLSASQQAFISLIAALKHENLHSLIATAEKVGRCCTVQLNNAIRNLEQSVSCIPSDRQASFRQYTNSINRIAASRV